MPYRRETLVEGELYHVFNRSIAGFRIFNVDRDYQRMRETIAHYVWKDPPCRFSFIERFKFEKSVNIKAIKKLVDVIAYCIMPTHIHLVLKQIQAGGISRAMSLISQSYCRYFNVKYKRKGPLWESRFKSVLVRDDDQLLHLTRYVHLNPVSANLVSSPENWKYCSYLEYLALGEKGQSLCNFASYLDMKPGQYKRFVEERRDYQRELEEIKHLILE